jgi:hypothetical protein
MAIKRNSCRLSERVRMRVLSEKGYSIPQISNATSVHEHIIDEVLSGRWAAAEKEGKKQVKLNEVSRNEATANEETNKAAAIAAATVRALKSLEAEELSPQQRGANTRKANAEKAELDAAAEAAEIPNVA